MPCWKRETHSNWPVTMFNYLLRQLWPLILSTSCYNFAKKILLFSFYRFTDWCLVRLYDLPLVTEGCRLQTECSLFFFISWRLITSQHFSGLCHILTWISHGVTRISHPNPPSHLSVHPIPLDLPSAPGQGTCLMHPAWAGDQTECSFNIIMTSFF